MLRPSSEALDVITGLRRVYKCINAHRGLTSRKGCLIAVLFFAVIFAAERSLIRGQVNRHA